MKTLDMKLYFETSDCKLTPLDEMETTPGAPCF